MQSRRRGETDKEKVLEMLTLNRAVLKGTFFSVVRADGMGATGALFSILPTSNDIFPELELRNTVQVGYSLCVGVFQWVTTPVQEIISVSKDKTEAKVRTENSVYSIEVTDL